jgi:signal transduction histidine kinase
VLVRCARLGRARGRGVRGEDGGRWAMMNRVRERARLRSRFRQPRMTVRWRLTLLYGGLFLVSGVALLAITYLLVAHAPIRLPPGRVIAIERSSRVPQSLRAARVQQRSAELHDLLIESGIALGIMASVSGLLGWVVAGRVLRPLRTMTAVTRQISETNLDQRLAIAGPGDELRELADTIDGLLHRLQRSFESQRRFIANASHELRTPLATMRTTLDVESAKPGQIPPRLSALDADLRGELDHADRLLEDFLVLARAQRGELGQGSPVALDHLIRAGLAARADRIAAKRIELRARLDSVRVAGTETLLARLVENVIDNAVAHNETGGFIEIDCTLDHSTARLVLANGGPALDDKAVGRLAEPFQRLGQERIASSDGHGLGLSIVAAIAEAHAGSLRLHVRPSGGLTVEILLPAATFATPIGVGQ